MAHHPTKSPDLNPDALPRRCPPLRSVSPRPGAMPYRARGIAASGRRRCLLLLPMALLAGFGALPGPVAGEITLNPADGLTLNLGLEAGMGVFNTWGTNFGAGRVDLRSGRQTATRAGGGLPQARGRRRIRAGGQGGTLYGGVSAVAAFTAGEGEPGDHARWRQRDRLETAFAGWRSGDWLADTLGEDALDLSFGRQDFEVGDGFLIQDGHSRFDDGRLLAGPALRLRARRPGPPQHRAGARGSLLSRRRREPGRHRAGRAQPGVRQEGPWHPRGHGLPRARLGTPSDYGPRDGMEV